MCGIFCHNAIYGWRDYKGRIVKDFVRNVLPTVKGRITLGVTFVLAVVVGIGLDTSRPISLEKIAAIILTGLAWLYAELEGSGSISDHDRTLFQNITGVIDQNALSFLHDHHYSVNFPINLTQPIHTIAEWHGPKYKFNDSAVEREWGKLRAQVNSLSEKYGNNLTSSPDNGEYLTVWHIGFSRNNQPARAHEEAELLTNAAHDVYRAFSKFVPYARRRLAL